MPLHEGSRPMKPEFEEHAEIQVATHSGAVASAMPEKPLGGHAVVPREASRKGARDLAADGGR
eukprot:6828553-Alexandrium_andersonii.AAC.1